MADQKIDISVRAGGGPVQATVTVEGDHCVWDCRYATGDPDLDIEIESTDPLPHTRSKSLGPPSSVTGNVHSCWTQFVNPGDQPQDVSVSVVWTQEQDGKVVVLKEHEQSTSLKGGATVIYRDDFFFWKQSSAVAKALAHLAVMVLLFSVSAVQGQTATPALSDLYIDFSVPSSTAFTLLGVEASRVARPGNVRALAVDLSNALTAAGEKGMGVELAPFQFIRDNTPVGYDGLRERLTLSVGVVQRADGGTRLGAGFRWVPVDHSDPYDDDAFRARISEALQSNRATAAQDAERSFNERLFGFLDSTLVQKAAIPVRNMFEFRNDKARLLLATPESGLARLATLARENGEVISPEESSVLQAFIVEYQLLAGSLNGEVQDRDDTVERAITAARKVFRDAHWNALSFQVAAGITGATPGRVDELGAETMTGFAGLSLPLGRRGQAILHAQGATPLDEGDPQYTVGGRFFVGGAARRFSVEALYGVNDDRLGDDAYRVLLGADIRIADGVYLEVATGVNMPDAADSNLLALGSIRYGLGTGQRFAVPGH